MIGGLNPRTGPSVAQALAHGRRLLRESPALAAEQVGGAQRVLDMTVDYAKIRQQFGRPIGSFQAVKHRLADMLVEVEAARSAAYDAARAVADEADDLELAGGFAGEVEDAVEVAGAELVEREFEEHARFAESGRRLEQHERVPFEKRGELGLRGFLARTRRGKCRPES